MGTSMLKTSITSVLGFLLLAGIMVVSTSNEVHAQDPEFTQYYANPLFLNPAFAGSDRCPRLVMAYRNQWPAMSGSYVTQAVSYDQHLQSIQGGLGLTVMRDQAGQNTLSTTRVTGMYAYQQALTRKISIRAALEASYFQKALDWSNLTFGDMIDPRRGFIYETQDTPRGGTVQNVDFGAGFLVFTEKFHLGFAAHHLNEPNESLVVGLSRLPMKLTVHGGGKFPLKTNIRREVVASISPSFLFRQQAEFKQMNLGLFVNKGPLFGGVWYRGVVFTEYRDALIAVLGVETDIMRFGYSYDITISELTPATGGAHELSMTLKFDCTQKKGKFRKIPCPTF
ncbi:MAG TPA: type IX secretion system membrane protein PorP/SprF [Flavobacteriales bacterium]|jgi:type IX secretion system PorP/SprF family membrane protein|nr:type IX secretion system membrane protein PorP/SprF [Flavobacteriales bacterium]HIN42300.1 type IX secretion system membrane protein PorP/SprF [Flavobacteriales bacterium]